MLIFLNNRSEEFSKLSAKALSTLKQFLQKDSSFEKCSNVIIQFIETSTYSARIFEVAIHAFFQVLDQEKFLAGFLKPLSQMRSANKKHGNIGDVEITATEGNMDIIEAWDAKYGKSYLRDELEELNDKLLSHPQVNVVGFITDVSPSLKDEIEIRIAEIQQMHGVELKILQLSQWVSYQIERFNIDKESLGPKWLIAITESICQLRREVAPIDEPTSQWVESLIKNLE